MGRAELPDILIISVDTMRRDAMAPYGCDLMPTASRLLEEGTAFDRCVATAPWTYPSFCSMITGLWPREHRALANYPRKGAERKLSILRADVPVLAETLSQAGYHTILSQGNTGWGGPGAGFTRGFDDVFMWSYDNRHGRLRRESKAMIDAMLHGNTWKFIHFTLWRLARNMGLGSLPVQAPMRDGRTLVNQACRMVRRAPKDKPVLCWVNFMDVHEPYAPPGRFLADAVPPGKVRPVHLMPFQYLDTGVSDEDKVYIRKRYDCCARFVDSRIRALLDRWGAMRSKRSRLTVFLSDHGEEFWDHGRNGADPTRYACGTGHGHTLFNELLRVPFVVHWPEGGVLPRRVRSVVSLIDLSPTLIDLLRLDVDVSGMSGRSQAAVATDASAPEQDDRVVFADSLYYGTERQAVLTTREKLIRCQDTGETQLFTWADDDPAERDNLADRPEYAETVRRLGKALDDWNASMEGAAEGGTLSEEDRKAMEAQLRDLGYI